MKSLTFILLTFASVFQAQLSPNDFRPLFGSWKGGLTYNDYRSGKPVKIPVRITVTELKADKNAIILFYDYPEEPKENGNDTIRISADRKMIGDKNIVAVKREHDLTKITAERSGEDNDKPATLRYTYTISSAQFIIRKEVKYNDAENYFFRNEYAMSR